MIMELERILARVEIVEQASHTSACWLWQGSRTGSGYGNIKVAGRDAYVHRVAYEHWHGPIPDGLEIDHLCHTVDNCAGGATCSHRACCNPDHLQAVTRSTNTYRGHSPALSAARQLAKAHCPAGHAYHGSNLYICPSGKRRCRECRRQADARRRARLAQAEQAHS